MNHQMSKIIALAEQCNQVLPTEIILKIFIEFNGLINPSALVIKNFMKEEFISPYTQIDYFIKYENVAPKNVTESLFDVEFITFHLGDEYEELYLNELSNANTSLI